jgi:dTDP-4-amino-4,6-dideoxygalactose transaminase
VSDRVYLSPPDVGEEERRLLVAAFDSNWIAPLGPDVDAFELEFAECVALPHAVALSSGTAGLHLALHTLGVGMGDEVLTSSLTFAATAFAITYMGALPVFVDVSPTTWTIDPGLLEDELVRRRKFGKLPRAVITVDLYGQCADYDQVLAICEDYDIPVIEDAAEALGAEYRGRPAGSFGRCAVFSFNGNKIITTGGGGMLVSDDRAITDHVRHLASQARDLAPHYEHSEIGYNYRLSNLLAAVGRGQLQSLDAKITRRREVKARYMNALASLPGISFMPEPAYGRSNCWLTCLLIEPSAARATREDIREHLESHNIEARPVWKPMHLQPVFEGCQVVGGRVAAGLFEKGLCLPSGSNLTERDQDRVIHAVQDRCA